MTPAQPLPEPSPAPPGEPAAPLSNPPERGGRRLDVWLDLLDRLAERRQQHEQGQAWKAAQPPSRAQILLDRAVWQVILFARWLRPFLARRAAAAHKATRTSWRRNTLIFAQQRREAHRHVRGWLLWQLRLLRTDPDRRLAAIGLGVGFAIPMTLIVTLGHLIPQDEVPLQPSDAAILQAPATATPIMADPSVPAPAAALIEEMPGEQLGPDAQEEDAVAALPEPEAAASSSMPSLENFRFEYFAQRSEDGNLRILSRGAENFLLQNFPLGTPAVNVMRFFGEVMMRSGSRQSEATLAAQARCMALPINRVFVAKTVTCTYGHDVPLPRAARESPRSRIFWIMALSYGRDGRLLDLRIHGRPTLATQH